MQHYIQGLNIAGHPDYILEGPKDQQKKFIGNAVVPHVVTEWIEQYHAELSENYIIPTVSQFQLFG